MEWASRWAERVFSGLGRERPAGGGEIVHAELRIVDSRHMRVWTEDGNQKGVEASDRGWGLRVLVRRDGRWGWGFASSPFFDEEAVGRVCAEACSGAAAALAFGGAPGAETGVYEDEEIFPDERTCGFFETPVETDPFELGASVFRERAAALDAMLAGERVVARRVFFSFAREHKFFFSSRGARLEQVITRSGAGMSVTVSSRDGSRVQERSHPSCSGNFGTGGVEFVDSFGLEEAAPRLRTEAALIVEAPECPREVTDVVLGPQMTALLVHEVAGHALELDRALGWESAFAGVSFLEPSGVGRFEYGAPLVNIVSDPTWPAAVATCGWDDEGTPSALRWLVKGGIHVGYLCGRYDAPLAGVEPSAAARADSWARIPIDRMTNVNLLCAPGNGPSVEEVMARAEGGLYLDVPSGWSINSDRDGFRFSVQIARRIRNGVPGDWYRNGAFSSPSTPSFWSRCAAVAAPPPVVVGFDNCAKGQPVQTQYTGHVVPAAVLFREVRVGEHG